MRLGILNRSLQQSRISKIGFFSPLAGVGVDCGYGYAAVQLINAWQRKNIPVWGFDREAPIAFNMGQPHFYERIDGALNIGYTPWESDEVPRAWVRQMNRMDEIWVPCSANAQWYIDGGIKVPVRVLHHGLNREHWPLKIRKLRHDEPFRFLHIGGDAPRKGADIVYKVFKELFGNDDRYQLTLKGRKLFFDVDAKNVTHWSSILPADLLTNLYLEHHAMIYPSKGEGFGLIPFQAAATGMPTAVTNWSGPVDYMKYCHPIRVSKFVEADYEPHEGNWAEPDENSVAYWMESFVRSPDYFFNKAFRNATRMDSYWSWDNIATIAIEFMTNSLEQLES